MTSELALRSETIEEREIAVLNALIRHPQASDELLAILREDDFYHDKHRGIFAAIVALVDRGDPVDPAAVAGEMERRGTFRNLGDRPAVVIHSMWEYSATAYGATSHAKAVREAAILRNLVYAAQRICSDATDPTGDCQEILAAAERAILDISEMGVTGQSVSLSQAVREAVNRLDARVRGETGADVPSGFRDLDALTAGFHNGELALVAARTSIGKTIFGLNIALKAAARGQGVFFASLEQSYIELAERALCNQGQVDSHRIRQGWVGEYEVKAISEAQAVLSDHNFWIDQQSSQTVAQIAANCRRHKRQHDIRLVLVDYLQLIQSASHKTPRQEQVAEISRRLKGLARDLNLPVIALTQVNRGPEDRTNQKPRLSDLRESGALEQDADVVIILHRLPVDPNTPPSDVAMIGVDVAKQRNGRTGDLTLAFRQSTMRFEDFQDV
jgi:replicative DNA helicase